MATRKMGGWIEWIVSLPLITQILSWCKSSVIQPAEQQELWWPWETTAAVWWYGGEGEIMYSVCVLLATAPATTVSTPLPPPSLLIILVRVKSDHWFLDFFTFIYWLRSRKRREALFLVNISENSEINLDHQVSACLTPVDHGHIEKWFNKNW